MGRLEQEAAFEWARSLPPHRCTDWVGPKTLTAYIRFGERKRCAVCDRWFPNPELDTAEMQEMTGPMMIPKWSYYLGGPGGH